MKRSMPLKRQYTMITALLFIVIGIIGLIPAAEDSGTNFLRLDPMKLKTIILNQAKGLMDSSAPVSEHLGDFTWQANLMPSSNTWGLSHPRQTTPVWERVLLAKQVFSLIGFFYAIMVIVLFFIFYQSSRTGVEEDGNSYN